MPTSHALLPALDSESLAAVVGGNEVVRHAIRRLVEAVTAASGPNPGNPALQNVIRRAEIVSHETRSAAKPLGHQIDFDEPWQILKGRSIGELLGERFR